MSRELVTLLTEKMDEMKRSPLMFKAAAAEAVVALAVAIITDHENRLMAMEGKNGEGTEGAGRSGDRLAELPGLRDKRPNAVGEK